MDKPEIRKIYEEMFAGAAPALHPSDIQLQFILGLVPKDLAAPILDAGCGDGRYAKHLTRLGYRNVCAIDLFEEINASTFNYRKSSIDDTSFDDESFEFAFSNSVIFYLEKPADGIREIGRVLKPGGVFFLTAHTKYSLFTYWRQAKLLLGLKSAQHLAGVKFYSAKEYEDMIRAHGFEMLLVDGYWRSSYIEPIYRRLKATATRWLGLPAADGRNRVPHSRSTAKLLTIIGYHSVLAAKKL